MIEMHKPEYMETEFQFPHAIRYNWTSTAKHLGDLMKIKRTDKVTAVTLNHGSDVAKSMLKIGAGGMVGKVLPKTMGVEIRFEVEE